VVLAKILAIMAKKYYKKATI